MIYDYEYTPTAGQPVPGRDFGVGDSITGPHGDRADVIAIRVDDAGEDDPVRYVIKLDSEGLRGM